MPTITPIQASLNAGEFSPRLDARTEFSKYPLACAELRNMLPLPQGGATRRPGTRFVAEVKVSTSRCRLLPFEFSEEQAYILEAGQSYLRFYKDRGQIVTEPTDATITNGTFAANITGWTNHSTGSASISHDAANARMNLNGHSSGNAHAGQAVSVGVSYRSKAHVLRFKIGGIAGDSVKLRIGSTATGSDILADIAYGAGYHCRAFTPGVGTIYVQFINQTAKTIPIDDIAFVADAPVEIATPFGEADLTTINYAQSADILYLCHPAHPIHRLERYGHQSWSLVRAAFTDGPYLKANTTTTTTITPSVASGLGITLTASAAVFVASDIGRMVRIEHGTTWGHAVITAFASATSVTADVKKAFGGTGAEADWRLGAWSATTGYPGIAFFFEQRLGLACTTHQPQTFWLSQSADFENMTPDDGAGEVADDDAIDYTISADQVNVIRWMVAYKELIIGTAGGEWTVRSEGSQLTPTDIEVRRHTGYGSARVDPTLMRGRLIYLQKARRKVLEFAYDVRIDGFQSMDLTLLADHMTRGGIEAMAYQQELESTLWCVRSDGALPTMTYQPDQQVVGWAQQILGGSFVDEDEVTGNAVAESVAVIPGASRDETWLICKRTINGVTRRYIEFVETMFERGDAPEEAFYVDCGLSYAGEPVDTITDLGHLEGETLKVLADGAVHPDATVSGGQITLQSPASIVQCGLAYEHAYKSLKWDAGSPIGTAQGQIKRIDGVTLVLLDSMNAKIGPSTDKLRAISFREVAHAMNEPIPLFTGELFAEFDGDYATDTRVCVRGDDPLPFTLLALAPHIKINVR